MGNIFLDLTDLKKWSGIHGGIQRVVYGISKEMYLTGNEKVSFVAFDKDHKRFYRTSFKPILNRVEGDNDTELIADVVSTESNRNALERLRRKLTKHGEQDKDWVEFRSGDQILVMGMSWETPDMQHFLATVRQNADVKVMQIIYDLIICLYPHLHHPANYEPYTKNMIEVIKNSDLLLPISQSSDRDLKRFAKREGLRVPKTRVIRLSDMSVDTSKTKPTKPSDKITKDFIACVGTVEVRKNHTLLYYTYKLAEQRKIELPQLVIVGGRGWYTGDLQHLLDNDPAIKEKILLLSEVNDEGLKWIFENCLFTVYPSIYEGWGLPIAESLAYGKLCLSSNTSSMPEIAGDLIDYFSPYSADECLMLIMKYLNKNERTPKEKRVKNNYKTTSWHDTANQIIGLI